jgi:hypothetical protein
MNACNIDLMRLKIFVPTFLVGLMFYECVKNSHIYEKSYKIFVKLGKKSHIYEKPYKYLWNRVKNSRYS